MIDKNIKAPEFTVVDKPESEFFTLLYGIILTIGMAGLFLIAILVNNYNT